MAHGDDALSRPQANPWQLSNLTAQVNAGLEILDSLR